MKIPVIYGSVRTAREGIRVVRWIENELRARGHDVERIDPAEKRLPLLDRMYKEFEPGAAPSAMQWIADRLAEADAFVVVSGEYNHAIPPALKNLLDHYQRVTRWRPAGIATYSAGRSGGARAQVPLRAVLGELGTVTIPTMITLGKVTDTVSEDGKVEAEALDDLRNQFVTELEWFAETLAHGRARGVPYGGEFIEAAGGA